jgi:hypothetical protein
MFFALNLRHLSIKKYGDWKTYYQKITGCRHGAVPFSGGYATDAGARSSRI